MSTENENFETLDFSYPTFHLRNFSILSQATGLYGERYEVIKKSLWYTLHGQILRKEIVRLGDIETDLRWNVAFPFPSGHGKLHIEHLLEKACEELGEKFSQPTSYHPEQLVGKTIRMEKKGSITYHEIKGHFADDLVLFEDAINLVRGQDMQYQDSRTYLCKALDTIGKNRLTKRPVDVPREHSLKYLPACTVVLLFQPYFLPEEVFLCGLFRRFLILYVGFDERDQGEYVQKANGEGKTDENIFQFSQYLKTLKHNHPIEPFIFTEEAKEKFNECHSSLIQYGKSYGDKASNFTNMIGYSLQEWLLKMICILAISRKKRDISTFEVEMAFCDLLEFLHSTLNFVENKVEGLLDYGESWHGAKGDDLKLLQWLHHEGVIDESSYSLSIADYILKIKGIVRLTDSGARARYNKHIRKGWIKSKQIGQHNSKVWLAFRPNLKTQGDKGDNVIQVYRKIIKENFPSQEISSEPRESLSPLSPSLPSPKFKIGDYVQRISQGIETFKTPRKIVRWDRDDGNGQFFYFVEGENVGIPENQVEIGNLSVELPIRLEEVSV